MARDNLTHVSHWRILESPNPFYIVASHTPKYSNVGNYIELQAMRNIRRCAAKDQTNRV